MFQKMLTSNQKDNILESFLEKTYEQSKKAQMDFW